MKRILFAGISIMLCAGCTTARLTAGPDVSVLQMHKDALSVGVPVVEDLRAGKKVGTIGAAGVNVEQDDLRDLATSHLVKTLNMEMGVNVVRTAASTEENLANLSGQYAVDRFVVAKIKEFKMFSADSLLQPVDVDMVYEVSVYDGSGKKIFRGSFNGQYSKRVGVVSQKGLGQLVEATVMNANQQMRADIAFQKALTA